MKKLTLQKINTAFLPLLTLSLFGCGDDSTTSSSGGGGGGAGRVSLSYQNARDGNALISLVPSSAFPAQGVMWGDRDTIGNFYQVSMSCVGANIPFTFTLKNTGFGTLNALQSPVITITDTTSYNAESSSDYSYTLTTAPTFPLKAGQSTEFTVTLNTLANFSCRFGDNATIGNTDAWTQQNFKIAVHTDDAENPNYSVDFVVLGNS